MVYQQHLLLQLPSVHAYDTENDTNAIIVFNPDNNNSMGIMLKKDPTDTNVIDATIIYPSPTN